MGKDPLHRHANLTGMIKAALGEQWRRIIKIGIRGDNDRRHAAVLQRAARARRKLAA